MNYTHITQAERYQIYALNKAGISQTKIARQLNRAPSTISRELKRNKGLKGYRPKQAQLKAFTRSAINAYNIPHYFYDQLVKDFKVDLKHHFKGIDLLARSLEGSVNMPINIFQLYGFFFGLIFLY